MDGGNAEEEEEQDEDKEEDEDEDTKGDERRAIIDLFIACQASEKIMRNLTEKAQKTGANKRKQN